MFGFDLFEGRKSNSHKTLRCKIKRFFLKLMTCPYRQDKRYYDMYNITNEEWDSLK